MSDPSGSLTIALRRDGSGVAVTIGSSRPVTAARVFAGWPLAEVAGRLPLLYSVCATAQAAACAAACERALDLRADDDVRHHRVLLLAAETVKEHLWRLLLDWPAALDRPPAAGAMAEVMRAWQALRNALDADRSLFLSGPAARSLHPSEVESAVRALTGCAAGQVFGRDPAVWLDEMRDGARLAAWAETAGTPAAALVQALIDEGLAGVGRSPVAALPAAAAAELGVALAAPDADAFVAAPTWQGEPRETTPFARCRDEPLIADLVADHGNGLLPRLAALLVELARHCAMLRTDEPAAAATPTFSRPPAPRPTNASQASAGAEVVGIGTAEAARGLLVHRVGIADGRVRSYRILAPTEWNFHPAGVVAAGLAAIAEAGPTDPAQLDRLARLLITAIDPCVAYRLSVS